MRSPILHFLGFWALGIIALYFLYQYQGKGTFLHIIFYTLPLFFLFLQSLLLKRAFLVWAALFLALFLPYLYYYEIQPFYYSYLVSITEILFAFFAFSRVRLRKSKAAPLIFMLAVLIALFFFSFQVLEKSYANYALYGGGSLLLITALLLYPFDKSFFLGALALFITFLIPVLKMKNLLPAEWEQILFFIVLYVGYYFVSYPLFRLSLRR